MDEQQQALAIRDDELDGLTWDEWFRSLPPTPGAYQEPGADDEPGR